MDLSLLPVLREYGLVAVGLIILIGGYRGWWVYGPTHREVERERDWWRTRALRLMEKADRAFAALEKER